MQVLKFIRFEVRFARREMRITFGRKPKRNESRGRMKKEIPRLKKAREEAKWTEGKEIVRGAGEDPPADEKETERAGERGGP